MKKLVLQMITFSFILLITYGTVENPYTSNYVWELKQTSATVSKSTDDLLQKIREKAPEYEISPKNAQVHKVWKAIPGLSGREVDVTRSYENMKSDGRFNERKLVFKQIPPEITLKDLPPSPIYKGNPDKEMVSFIINVAWGNEYIPGMLKTLKENGVHATFFLEGRWVKNNPNLAKMIVDYGHEVGNHSYTHANFKTISSAQIKNELEQTNNVIKAVTGKEVKWFAPPSGNYRDEAVAVASKLNMGTVLWSVDTIDWKNPVPSEMVSRVEKKVHPGAMILMHPTSSTDKGLQEMITRIKEKGYEIDTASSLLGEERVKNN